LVVRPRKGVPGDIERIVYENERFAVVAKRGGVPADVARGENPRG
jgi:hypothetical protein